VNQQAAAPLPHGRENGAIHADHPEQVDVEYLLELFGRVGFRDADARHPRIVDDDIEVRRAMECAPHGILYRVVVGDVELQHLQAEPFACGQLFERFAMFRVPSLGVPHGREHLMAAARQLFGGVPTEPCARAGDEYHTAHASLLHAAAIEANAKGIVGSPSVCLPGKSVLVDPLTTDSALISELNLLIVETGGPNATRLEANNRRMTAGEGFGAAATQPCREESQCLAS
jgi:hypothetical protein